MTRRLIGWRVRYWWIGVHHPEQLGTPLLAWPEAARLARVLRGRGGDVRDVRIVRVYRRTR